MIAPLSGETALFDLLLDRHMLPIYNFRATWMKELEHCEVHMTHIPTPGDEAGLRRLGVNLTSDPNFSSKNLFIS